VADDDWQFRSLYVGVEASRGGLAFGAFAVGAVLGAEKLTNMLLQPYAGRLSDRYGRALFADEGAGSGIASSFGVRNLVWRPGSVLAPLLGGVLMDGLGMEWVFVVVGATALSGVVTFLGILSYDYGTRALTEW